MAQGEKIENLKEMALLQRQREESSMLETQRDAQSLEVELKLSLGYVFMVGFV